MNKNYSKAIISIITICMVCVSCKKDDEVKLTSKDSVNVLEVLNKSQWLVNGLYTPYNDAKDVPIGTEISIKPKVSFGIPFEVDLAGTTCTYRYNLLSCTLTDPLGNNFITDYRYSEQDSKIIISNNILKPNTKYTLTSTIGLYQLVSGEWKPVIYHGSEKVYSSSSSFITGQFADKINSSDILFSYPIDRMLNYMSAEYTEGYIMLSNNYRELFENVLPKDMKLVVNNITDDTKLEQSTNFTVKESHEVDDEVISIDYSLKDITFEPNQIYSFSFYCGDKMVHQIHIRTSIHSTFKDKIENNNHFFEGNLYDDWFDDTNIGSQRKLMIVKELDECFDKFECQTFSNHVFGNERKRDETISTCLITFEFDLDKCDWYQTSLYKLLYDSYPPMTETMGIIKNPPINAVEFFGENITQEYLSDYEINNKTINNRKTWIFLRSYLADYLFREYTGRVDYIKSHPDRTETDIFIMQNQPTEIDLSVGKYSYILSYRLPGKNIITTSLNKTMNY